MVLYDTCQSLHKSPTCYTAHRFAIAGTCHVGFKKPASSLPTYRLVRPLYPDGRRPRQAGPALAFCPDLTLLLPLSRFTLTDGQMVRAAWHTIGLLWPGFSGCLVLSGAVRCTDLRAFLLQGPAVYLISAHSEPTCAHSISGARASTPVQSPVAPAAMVLASVVF